jgi:hypothetical protein
VTRFRYAFLTAAIPEFCFALFLGTAITAGLVSAYIAFAFLLDLPLIVATLVWYFDKLDEWWPR